MKFNSIPEAIAEIKKGKMVIVVDDEDRENEGDLLMAAEKVTPQAINFMAKFGRGLICTPITQEKSKCLELELMVHDNTDKRETAFTVSVDAKGVSTGISAYERCETIKAIINPNTRPEDLTKPGHIFPLIAKEGGVLKRAGHTEAAVDIAIMAGLIPVGVICEIMSDDGKMARVPELMEFAKTHGLKIITIADLIEHRRKQEKLIKLAAVADMPTEFGDFKIYAYENITNGEHHVALVKGQIKEGDVVSVRVHSECLTGDALKSIRCDCGEQLQTAMQIIENDGKGVILYMRQEGRGIGLVNKIKAYELQDKGKDTVEANILLGFPPDLRDYGIGAQILKDLGLNKIKLITNNPKKVVGLQGYDLEIVERIPIEIPANIKNEKYLKTKREKMGHLLENVFHD
jgi:3,4-dihydroxy 2-butanone 4-phosphate synthase/GTP cyclohydrolase II